MCEGVTEGWKYTVTGANVYSGLRYISKKLPLLLSIELLLVNVMQDNTTTKFSTSFPGPLNFLPSLIEGRRESPGTRLPSYLI